MLNGDHVWNQYVKKNLKKDYKEGKKSRVKNAYGGGPNIRGVNGAKVMRALAFNIMDVKQLLDYTIFVDVEQETQLDRRIYRDQETRGYSRSAIIYQWENHALPCYENYIYPYKNKADFIFRNDHRADEDFQELMKSIQLALSNIATP